VFYRMLAQGGTYQDAIAVALLTATGFICLVLVAAVLELRAHRRRHYPQNLTNPTSPWRKFR
jgi:hypothetical protein